MTGPVATAPKTLAPTGPQPGVPMDVVERALVASAKGAEVATSARMTALWGILKANPNDLSWGAKISQPMGARLLLFCAHNGLDPMGNDVFILGDRPYVSFEGRTKLAFRSGVFQGYEEDRMLTQVEHDALNMRRGSLGWTAVIRRSDCKFGFRGYGEAGGEGENYPVAKQRPLEMAQKRARERGLKMAFPIDILVPDEEVIEEVKAEATVCTAPTAPPLSPEALQAARGGPTESEKAAQEQDFQRRVQEEEAEQSNRSGLVATLLGLCMEHHDAAGELWGGQPPLQNATAPEIQTWIDELRAKVAAAPAKPAGKGGKS